MTENNKRELRSSFFKMIIWCIIVYGAIGFCVLTENEWLSFLWVVGFGFFVSIGFLMYQIILTYRK